MEGRVSIFGINEIVGTGNAKTDFVVYSAGFNIEIEIENTYYEIRVILYI